MVIISTNIFNLLFYSVILFFGVDFILSGVFVLREKRKHFKKPKLLGFWIMQRMNVLHGSTNSPKWFSTIYSMRNLALQSLFAGSLIVISSLLMIVDVGMRLF